MKIQPQAGFIRMNCFDRKYDTSIFRWSFEFEIRPIDPIKTHFVRLGVSEILHESRVLYRSPTDIIHQFLHDYIPDFCVHLCNLKTMSSALFQSLRPVDWQDRDGGKLLGIEVFRTSSLVTTNNEKTRSVPHDQQSSR